MNIEKQTVGAVTILTFQGEFDAAADASRLDEIDGLIGDSKRVIFNFRELKFMNSAALGYLLKTVKALRDQGGDLVYSEPAGSFLKIVDVYGIGAVFRVFASDRAALEHFGESGDASYST
jgi:anti-sigma B factor antagonist